MCHNSVFPNSVPKSVSGMDSLISSGCGIWPLEWPVSERRRPRSNNVLIKELLLLFSMWKVGLPHHSSSYQKSTEAKAGQLHSCKNKASTHTKWRVCPIGVKKTFLQPNCSYPPPLHPWLGTHRGTIFLECHLHLIVPSSSACTSSHGMLVALIFFFILRWNFGLNEG